MKRILIGGGSGLIGQKLSQMLSEKGYEVRLLSRSSNQDSKFRVFTWDTQKGIIEDGAFDNLDYVINLAGAGIADKRWSDFRKKLIIDSRVNTTALLWKYILQNKSVKAFVSASAIGFYGDSGEQVQTEDASSGSGFLSESTKAWEEAVFKNQDMVRTAALRIGIVSSTKGGAFEKLLLPIKYGLTPYFGNGKQWYSWVHLEDICRMFIHLIETDNTSGVYNGVSPNPSRLKNMLLTTRKVIGIPGIAFPIPEFLMRLPMGEMADVLFNSTLASSKKIEASGFDFHFPELKPALKDLIQR